MMHDDNGPPLCSRCAGSGLGQTEDDDCLACGGTGEDESEDATLAREQYDAQAEDYDDGLRYERSLERE